MKKLKLISILFLLFVPNIVYASSLNDFNIPISMALFMEAFVSIHMSAFVLKPLANMLFKNNSNKAFWTLFAIRAGVLLFFDFFITPSIAAYDFFAVFIGAFIVVPITAIITKAPGVFKNGFTTITNVSNVSSKAKPNVVLKCANCGATLSITDKVCKKCNTPFVGNNVHVEEDISPVVPFNNMYLAQEKSILRDMLKEEVKNQGESILLLSTHHLNVKKTIFTILFGAVTLFSVLLYFFNISIKISIAIEIIACIIYLIICKQVNVLNALVKRAVSKPDVEISEIVSSFRKEKVNIIIPAPLKTIIVLMIAVILPCLIFYHPRMLFIRYGDGYQVFKYTKGITKSDNEIVIPDTYNYKPVLAIGESAFANTIVEKVTIPYGIESIKTKAFYNAKNIRSIEVPGSVSEIRGDAFANMTSLTNITLHEGLKEIRGGAFANDYNLNNVNLPESLEYLGGSAFSNCTSITEVTIPSKITEINGGTFEYMTSLKNVNMHDGITYIHGEVFVGDVSLESVALPSKIKEVKGSTFEGCRSLTSIEIPEGVTRIGGHAFHGCTSLTYVYVPTTVTEIGSSAFRECYSLTDIKVPRGAYINERAFKNSPTRISYYE